MFNVKKETFVVFPSFIYDYKGGYRVGGDVRKFRVFYTYWHEGLKFLLGTYDNKSCTPDVMLEASTYAMAAQGSDIKGKCTVQALIQCYHDKLAADSRHRTIHEIVRAFALRNLDIPLCTLSLLIS